MSIHDVKPILDHVWNARNTGDLTNKSHTGASGVRGGGPYITVHFRVVDGVIAESSYECNGCPATIACASALVELCQDKSITQALQVDELRLEAAISGFPAGKRHCLTMAIEALRSAFAKGD